VLRTNGAVLARPLKDDGVAFQPDRDLRNTGERKLTLRALDIHRLCRDGDRNTGGD
jgi:hypothetical protein